MRGVRPWSVIVPDRVSLGNEPCVMGEADVASVMNLQSLPRGVARHAARRPDHVDWILRLVRAIVPGLGEPPFR